MTQVATSEKVVALTFDDGPGVHTDEILRILEEHNVKATFFLTGREIKAHRDKAQKIAKAGHQIGNHSYSHQRMVFKSPTFIRIVNYVRERIEPGSIILLHVMYESRTASLKAVEGIITALKQEGYSFVTVSELLSYQEESPLPTKP